MTSLCGVTSARDLGPEFKLSDRSLKNVFFPSSEASETKTKRIFKFISKGSMGIQHKPFKMTLYRLDKLEVFVVRRSG